MASRILIFLIYALPMLGYCQSRNIEGAVLDSETNEPIEFASVKLSGSTRLFFTDQAGVFSFDGVRDTDTLRVVVMGYLVSVIPVNQFVTNQRLTVLLTPEVFDLSEVVISPLSAEEMLQLAKDKIKENYPSQSYSGNVYYSDQLYENNTVIQDREGVFNSFFKVSVDSFITSHQLVLYNERSEYGDIHFAQKRRDKEQEKRDKEAKKNGEDAMTEQQMINVLFGGPQQVLYADIFYSQQASFFDSTRFKKFTYSYDLSDTVASQVSILFKSTKTVDYMRQSGKVVLDRKSLAIKRIEFNGDFVIPVYLKTLLVLTGYRIKSPFLSGSINYSELNGAWYPSHFEVNGSALLVKTKLFKKNERGQFDFNQEIVISNIEIEEPREVPKNKEYDKAKEMSLQLFPENNLKWRDVKTSGN